MKWCKWAVFTIGFLALLIGFGIALNSLQEYQPIVLALLGVLGLAVILLISIAVTRENERWMALLLSGILISGFSAMTIFSIGLLIFPIALLLVCISVWKLRHNQVG